MLDSCHRQHRRRKRSSLSEDIRDLCWQRVWQIVGHGALQISHPVVVAGLLSRVVVRRTFAAHSRPLQLEDVHRLGVAAAAQILLARGE